MQLAPGAAQTSACAAGITTFAQTALARGFARRSTRTGRALALRQDGAVATAEFAWQARVACPQRSATACFSLGQQSCDARFREVPPRVRFRRHGRWSQAGALERLTDTVPSGWEREELAAACNFAWPCRSACSPDLRRPAICAKLFDGQSDHRSPCPQASRAWIAHARVAPRSRRWHA